MAIYRGLFFTHYSLFHFKKELRINALLFDLNQLQLIPTTINPPTRLNAQEILINLQSNLNNKPNPSQTSIPVQHFTNVTSGSLPQTAIQSFEGYKNNYK